MDKLFQRIVDHNFSELKGTTVSASVPVPEDLINELIEVWLKDNKNIDSLQASLHPQNRVSLKLKTTLLPWALNVKLKLDTSVDFASYSSPKVRAWLENNRLLGSLGSFFNGLSEGVKLYGNQVVVDIGYFLRTPEQKHMLKFVKSVSIRTEEGTLILDIRIGVD